MKLVIVAFLFATVACAFATTAEEEWENFKTKFEKTYEVEEEKKRFDIFKENLAFIEDHNAKFARGETTFEVGVNKFADRTEEEKKLTRGLGGIRKKLGGGVGGR